jgi:beta-lactamase class A
VPTTTQAAEATTGSVLVNSPDGKPLDAELLGRLSGILKAHKDELSLYYKDLTTGYSIEFRADEVYQTASVIKAPYVKYLLESGADLTKSVKTTTRMGGTKYVDDQPLGTAFTNKQLMEYAIRYSDNTAYYMLNEQFGFTGFNAYAQKLGIRANADRECVLSFPKPRFGYLSARDAGLYFEDIAAYIAKGGEKADMLKTWLTSTTADSQLAAAFDNYAVAHKYGMQDVGNVYSRAYHDAGIIYAPHPYVLTVLTNMEANAAANKVFTDVAALIDAIQTPLYAAG